MRRRIAVGVAIATGGTALALAVSATSAPKPISRAEFSSGLLQLQAMAEDASFSGGGGQVSKLTFACTAGNPLEAVDISCDDDFNPDNEIAVAVNPDDADHLVAGSNDYWLAPKGATLVARVPSGFFVSGDGGANWLDGQVPMGSGAGGGNGDPVVAFNKKFGSVHMLQLNAGCGQAGPYCGHISVAVSTSSDGGQSFGSPVVVGQGTGSLTPSASGVFNDKPWMTVDNDTGSPYYGRAYVTFTKFELAKGGYIRSPIMLSRSDDGGKSWTPPKEISGSNASLCTYQEFGPAGECDEDQFSVPVVLSDGSVVVHFANGQNLADWESPQEFESQVLVVRSTDGGTTWSAPVKVAALEDGAGTDYPLNVDGRATQTGYQFRTQSVQGMTVDPVTDDLYAFWTDNSAGTHDAPSPVTESQVYIAKSTDGGTSWVTSPVTSGTDDRWMPWVAAYDGVVGLLYMEEGPTDSERGKTYTVQFRSSTDGGTTWSSPESLNDPSFVNYSIWFRAGSRAPDCSTCSRFIGDYNGLAAALDGDDVVFHAVWTDMNRVATYAPLGRTGAPEDAYYAKRVVATP